ncbi:hypothetical protein FAIPA1_60017 [Frankia sp. AiPs1]|uniref:hypothetical protein n=1 Tax=Frankia sp. AiPa1 TaxID=573492 RepID=UPI00202B83D7|nr:hypothetical protein [Frankia sp. AiPa1]MCL9762711.1 hypothetical protein [Frankia sp. AiPa1]
MTLTGTRPSAGDALEQRLPGRACLGVPRFGAVDGGGRGARQFRRGCQVAGVELGAARRGAEPAGRLGGERVEAADPPPPDPLPGLIVLWSSLRRYGKTQRQGGCGRPHARAARGVIVAEEGVHTIVVDPASGVAVRPGRRRLP